MSAAKQHNKLSIRDVARMAGVSTAAVSKALNNKPDVSEKLRHKVQEICLEFGYRVNPSIQDLARAGRNGAGTRNIGFVLVEHNFCDPAYSMALDGMARATRQHNMHLVLANLSGREKTVFDLPPIIRDNRADGFVVTGELTPDIVGIFRQLGTPFVILGTYAPEVSEAAVSVEMDWSACIGGLVRGLTRAGRRRIAMFNEHPGNYFERHCRHAFRTAVQENGLSWNDNLVYSGSGYFSGAFEPLKAVFQKPRLPFDSIVSMDFRTACDISHLALARAGLKNEPEVLVGTLRRLPQEKLPIPAVYGEPCLDQVAFEGVRVLLELVNGDQEIAAKKIVINPAITIYS